MSGKEKRERKPNYTPEEKTYLTELIAQYKGIIDDKRTTGLLVKKKNEAWKAVTSKFNSRCTTGPREMDNLKALYDNMKQKARRSIGGSNGQMNKTGGGLNIPKPIDPDMNILSIVKVEVEQVEPLSNSYDSTADYFKDDMDKDTSSSPVKLEIDLAKDTETINDMHKDKSWGLHRQSSSFGTPPVTEVIKSVEYQHCLPNKRTRKRKAPPNKLSKHTSAETLKRLYFKKKCQNAYLEGKKLMQEILQGKQKHNLEMTILRKTLATSDYATKKQ